MGLSSPMEFPPVPPGPPPLEPLSPQLRLAVRGFARAHRLTRRERDVLELVVGGHVSAADIADRMDVSVNTVHNHCKNIYRRTRTQGKASVLSRLLQFVADSPDATRPAHAEDAEEDD